jgi:hypothetical protein
VREELDREARSAAERVVVVGRVLVSQGVPVEALTAVVNPVILIDNLLRDSSWSWAGIDSRCVNRLDRIVPSHRTSPQSHSQLESRPTHVE